jgi:hypothetical protein
VLALCHTQDGDILDDDEEEEERKIGPHPDAATTLIFTNHQNNGMLRVFWCVSGKIVTPLFLVQNFQQGVLFIL